MKKNTLLLFILLCSCSPVKGIFASPTFPSGQLLRDNNVQATPFLISDIATIAPDWSPTPDYDATKISAVATSDEAQLQISIANKAAADIAATSAGEDRLAQAASDETQTAQDAVRATTSANDRAIIEIRATQTKEYPAVLKSAADAQATASTAQARAWVNVFLALMVGLFLLCCVVFALSYGYMYLMAQQPAQEEPEYDENEVERVQVVQTNSQAGHYLAADQYQFVLPAERMDAFWEKVARRYSISYRNFTPLENGFSQDEFNMLCSELIEFGLAEKSRDNDPRSGLHLTIAGRELAKKYATISPTPDGFIPVTVK